MLQFLFKFVAIIANLADLVSLLVFSRTIIKIYGNLCPQVLLGGDFDLLWILYIYNFYHFTVN